MKTLFLSDLSPLCVLRGALRHPTHNILAALLVGLIRVTAADSKGVPALIEAHTTNGQTQARISWPAEPDHQYNLLSTSEFGVPWEISPFVITPTNLIGETQVSTTNRARFFRPLPR